MGDHNGQKQLKVCLTNVSGGVIHQQHGKADTTDAGRLTALEKTLFFQAVAQLKGLKELHMPQWDVFIGRDARACVEPLRRLQDLKAIHVSRSRGKEWLQDWIGLQFISSP